MKNNPTVLQILPALEAGGVERATIDIAIALSAVGPTYVASVGGRLIKNLEKNHHVHHICLPLNSKNPLTLLKNAKRIYDLVKTLGIDIVHAHSRAPAWSAYLACRWARKPLVTTYHAAYKGKSFLKKLYNSIMARGVRVITISDFIDRHVRQIYPESAERLVKIKEGIDTNYFSLPQVSDQNVTDLRHSLNIPENYYIVLLPVRLTRIKGPDILLKAMAHLKTKEWCVLMAGGPGQKQDYVDELKELIRKLKIEEHVKFLSTIADLRPYYRLADIVVVPSIVPEAFGRVTAEAGAMEKLVIGTNLGATPEVCLHEETGFIVPAEDEISLAHTIEKVLHLGEEGRQFYGKRARFHIQQNFDLNISMQKTIRLYQEVFSIGFRHE
jgi:glycosyltransferase involved in cell wall biosynthesis